jgi:hypothetical protein
MFFDTPSFSRPLKAKPLAKEHPALTFSEKSAYRTATGRKVAVFDPDAEDGDGDGKVQDNTPFERPDVAGAAEAVADGLEAATSRFKSKYGYEPKDGEGDCFSSAIDTAKKLKKSLPEDQRDSIRIVHGMPLGTGGEAEGIRFNHAWVETDDVNDTMQQIMESMKNIPADARASYLGIAESMRETGMLTTIHDNSNGREITMPLNLYYSVGDIDPEDLRKYTLEEAEEMMARHGHYGPWE